MSNQCRSAYSRCRAVFKGGVTGSNPLRNHDEKNFMCPSGSVFFTSVQWSFNLDQFMQLLTVNWLKIQSKWLLSGAWFYALISPKIVYRPGFARTRWGSLQRSHSPLAGSWGRDEKGEMEGQEGREGRGRKEQRRRGGKGRERGLSRYVCTGSCCVDSWNCWFQSRNGAVCSACSYRPLVQWKRITSRTTCFDDCFSGSDFHLTFLWQTVIAMWRVHPDNVCCPRSSSQRGCATLRVVK